MNVIDGEGLLKTGIMATQSIEIDVPHHLVTEEMLIMNEKEEKDRIMNVMRKTPIHMIMIDMTGYHLPMIEDVTGMIEDMKQEIQSGETVSFTLNLLF